MNCTSCNTVLDSRATFCPNCGATVPDPLLGQTLGAFTVEKRISIGTFGSIYRAANAAGDLVAIKVMHRELAADTSLVERFRQEGSVMQQLASPNIVRTYEFGQTPDGLPYIVMELLYGQTVLDRLRIMRPLPWQQALTIGSGVCQALDAAHAFGVVHRDLKPGNIFVVEPHDTVKVLDFGIAKILSAGAAGDPKELTIMGTAVGTVEYMAPEQLMGGKADRRTDIYTLGVVMYEMAVGRRPFNAAGLELLTEQLSAIPPKPSERAEGLPASVDDILMRCLAADLDDRYQTARELHDALVAAVESAPTPPPAVPIPPPPPLAPDTTWQIQKTSPSRWPLAIAAGIALVLAIVIVALRYA